MRKANSYRHIFLRLKNNGVDYRMILDLKKLNSFVKHKHFKMESLHSVIGMMTPNCYMASKHIKDIYYTVPKAIEDQKYKKCAWRNKLYQYTCLANGLSSAPRIFTKIMKPVIQTLRHQGHISSSGSAVIGFSLLRLPYHIGKVYK